MNLFIDCEWNQDTNQLISMALVPEDDTKVFYKVIGCSNPTPWVKENVMPHISSTINFNLLVNYSDFQQRLEIYLNNFPSIHIIADWPEDIEVFCKAIITGPGTRLNTPPLTIEISRIDSQSEFPHHALYDALAFKKSYLELMEQQK